MSIHNRRTMDSPLYKSQSPLITFEDENSNHSGEVAIQMPMEMIVSDRRGSRNEAVLSIERTIGELQGIFQQLANLVAEQGELIERIDDNVNNTVVNVDRAQSELLKYLSSVSSNRWLIVKLFLVLVVFVVLFIVFFV